MPTGYLMRDSEHKDENKDETEGKKKNGNGNGSNGNGNGNGGSNGGSNGGGVSESKDHEVAMAQSQLKKSEENIRKLRRALGKNCLLYTSPSPRDATLSRMPSSA